MQQQFHSPPWVLASLILKLNLRKLSSSLPLYANAFIAMSLVFVLGFVAKITLYDQLVGLLGIVGPTVSIEQKLAAFLAVSGIAAVCISGVAIIGSFNAIRPASEPVVSLPIYGPTWHKLNVLVYSLLVSLIIFGSLTVTLVAASSAVEMPEALLPWLLVINIEASVAIGMVFYLVLLPIQEMNRFKKLLATYSFLGLYILCSGLVHLVHLDTKALHLFSQLLASDPIIIVGFWGLLIGGTIILILKFERHLSGIFGETIDLQEEAAGNKSGIAKWAIKKLPSIFSTTLISMLRDRYAIVGFSLGFAAISIVSIYSYQSRNEAGIQFSALLSPVLLALLSSVWISRLRSYLGRSRLGIYALPINPLRVITFQGLPVTFFLSAFITVLIGLQQLYLFGEIRPDSLSRTWTIIFSIFSSYYLVSVAFSQSTRSFTTNGAVDIATVIATYITLGFSQFINVKTSDLSSYTLLMIGYSVVVIILSIILELYLSRNSGE